MEHVVTSAYQDGPDADPPAAQMIEDATEHALLGAMMSGRKAIEAALDAGFEVEWLSPLHQPTGLAIVQLWRDGQNADLLTVGDHLKRSKDLKRLGGLPYLQKLIVACDNPMHAADYTLLVKDRYIKWRLAAETNGLRNALLVTAPDDMDELLAKHAAEMSAIQAIAARGKTKTDRMPRVSFADLFAEDFSQVDFLPGRFMERAQQIAVVGEGKAGKSLLILFWVWCAIRGERFLGDTRREPLRVQYWDRENSRADLFHRLRSFGADADDLAILDERLDYRQFPALSGSLDDSAAAAAEMLAAAEEFKPDVVILDTVSRFIAGNENDSSTWLALYRQIHEPLKRAGIGSIRLDHMGKDTERGSRGSSAKNQDVDAVWELTVDADVHKIHDRAAEVETITTQLRFKRTHTRSGLGNDLFWIMRRAQQEMSAEGVRGMWVPGRTTHALTDNGTETAHNTRVESYVKALAAAAAPPMGRDKLKAWAASHGVELPGKNSELADVASAYKAECARLAA